MGIIGSDVIIIGAGPAGIACAVQLRRYGIDCVILEKGRVGGLLHSAGLIENYPGFPAGIKAEKLIALLEKHAEKYDLNIVTDSAELIDFYDNHFCVKTPDNEYCSDYLVIAAGTEPKNIEVIDPDDNVKRRIFFTANEIDTAKFKDVAIIGAGDAAFDYALQLSALGCKVKIFNRSDNIKAIGILVRRAEEDRNIQYFENYRLKAVSFDVEKNLITEFIENNKSHFIKSDCLIFAVGRKPSYLKFGTNLIDNFDILTESRVFMIGDYKNELFRQVSIATGDGIKAAMMIDMNIRQKKI